MVEHQIAKIHIFSRFINDVLKSSDIDSQQRLSLNLVYIARKRFTRVQCAFVGIYEVGSSAIIGWETVQRGQGQDTEEW